MDLEINANISKSKPLECSLRARLLLNEKTQWMFKSKIELTNSIPLWLFGDISLGNIIFSNSQIFPESKEIDINYAKGSQFFEGFPDWNTVVTSNLIRINGNKIFTISSDVLVRNIQVSDLSNKYSLGGNLLPMGFVLPTGGILDTSVDISLDADYGRSAPLEGVYTEGITESTVLLQAGVEGLPAKPKNKDTLGISEDGITYVPSYSYLRNKEISVSENRLKETFVFDFNSIGQLINYFGLFPYTDENYAINIKVDPAISLSTGVHTLTFNVYWNWI